MIVIMLARTEQIRGKGNPRSEKGISQGIGGKLTTLRQWQASMLWIPNFMPSSFVSNQLQEFTLHTIVRISLIYFIAAFSFNYAWINTTESDLLRAARIIHSSRPADWAKRTDPSARYTQALEWQGHNPCGASPHQNRLCIHGSWLDPCSFHPLFPDSQLKGIITETVPLSTDSMCSTKRPLTLK